MLLLKIVYVPLTCVSSPSYIPNIFQIYFFIVSQICWMLYFKVVLELIFSWFDVYLSSIMTSMPEILISLTLFESQRFLFDFLNFFLFPGFPWFWFSLLILFSAPTLFYSFPSTICFCFLGFLLGFVRVLFKTSTIVVKAVLRSQSCDSAMLQFSGPSIVTFPDSNRDIFSLLLLIVYLHWHIGIRMTVILSVGIWSCLCCVGLLLFGFHFSLLFFRGSLPVCVFPGRKCFWCLARWSLFVLSKLCFQVLRAYPQERALAG